MSFNVFSIGIIFNALASGFVAAIALALVIFLSRRWDRLDPVMKAYTWFWWFTALVWIPSSIRYILAGFGYTGAWIRNLDIIVQTAVFFTGPALFYYIILRVFRSKLLADILAGASFALGLLSMWFLFQPKGVPIRDVTDFSADATINSVSFAIFSIQISVLLFLLLYDIITNLHHWRQYHNQSFLYEALYNVAIVIYVILGSVDESKIITGWPLVAFRLLYSGAFMFAYLIVTQEEEVKQAYFLEDPRTNAPEYGR